MKANSALYRAQGSYCAERDSLQKLECFRHPVGSALSQSKPAWEPLTARQYSDPISRICCFLELRDRVSIKITRIPEVGAQRAFRMDCHITALLKRGSRRGIHARKSHQWVDITRLLAPNQHRNSAA